MLGGWAALVLAGLVGLSLAAPAPHDDAGAIADIDDQEYPRLSSLSPSPSSPLPPPY